MQLKSYTDHERGQAIPHGAGRGSGSKVRGEGHGVSVRFALDLEAPVVVLVERVTADVAHLLRTHVGLRQSLLLFVRSFWP